MSARGVLVVIVVAIVGIVTIPVGAANDVEWAGTWAYGPPSGFQLTRFDGEVYPGNGLAYFLGGRLADSNTDGSIWSFDPATGIYTDTGVDMPVPISNYQVNLLYDGVAWGLYTFCGRPQAGGVVDTVQVYYPDSNNAAALPGADDFPGAGNCTSALNAVYGNHAYLAGGFDSTANSADTWVFDPTAASGSRWSQLASANLVTARAYIMSAVVDDMIYAIGGNYYDATSTACGQVLCDVTTVEVLDPAVPTPTWNDAAVTDLPEVCSSARAWGFDTGSLYVDPGDATPLAGRIVTGCGGWPAETNHVLVLDTVANSWTSFPHLQDARRDHAAAMLPNASPPGIWVWGGRQGADTTVLQTAEFFAFSEVPVELMSFTIE